MHLSEEPLRRLKPELEVDVYYCGADVHSTSTTLHMLDAQGREVCLDTIATTEARILEFLLGLPKHTRFYLEAGTQSAWFARLVNATGHRAVVVDPSRNRLIAESVKKTDRNDAAALAALGRAGMLSEVWVRQEETDDVRRLLTARHILVSARANIVKSVRSMSRAVGVRLPKADTSRFADLAEGTSWPVPDVIRPAADLMVGACRALTEKITAVEQATEPFAKQHGELLARLQTVPGVGKLVALSFITHIEEPGRFQSKDQVAAYLGLVPRVRESGGHRRDGHITKRGSKNLRAALIQGAWAHYRSGHPTALKKWFDKASSRVGTKKAIVGLARKLAELLWTLWMKGSTYQAFPPSSRRAAPAASVA